MAEVLPQRAPLEGDDFVQLGFAAANATVRPTPRTLGAQVSDEVEAVFRKASPSRPPRATRALASSGTRSAMRST